MRNADFWKGPLLTLFVAILLYLGFAYHEEWRPFPHHATPQELAQKKTYEWLYGLNADAFIIDNDFKPIAMRIGMLQGQGLSNLSSDDQKELSNLILKQDRDVQNRKVDQA